MLSNLKAFFAIASLTILTVVTGSCNKIETAVDAPNGGVSLSRTRAVADNGFGFWESAFMAGQSIEAGTITICNDYENVYVTFATKDGWQMGKTHLFIGPKEILLNPENGYVNKQGSPKNGHFPYGETFDPTVTEWVFTLPLIDLYAMFYGELAPDFYAEKATICPVVAAHAEVMKQIGTTEEGEPVWQTETAWGEGKKFVKKGNWSMYIDGYCVLFPPEDPEEPEEPTYEFKTETAWAFDVDNPLEYGGNWAKYIQYNGEPLTVMLLAGQKETEMTVTLTPAGDGKVQMTFAGIFEIAPENDGKWVLQDVKDAIKVQGYAEAPSGNPAPGQFTYYKGRDLTIVVDAANYYGIHLDVAKLTVIK